MALRAVGFAYSALLLTLGTAQIPRAANNYADASYNAFSDPRLWAENWHSD